MKKTVLLIASIMLASLSMAQLKYYIHFEGNDINDQSAPAYHSGWVQIKSVSQTETPILPTESIPSAADKRNNHLLKFTRIGDNNVFNVLKTFMTQGKQINTVVIEGFKNDVQNEKAAYTLRVSDAFITKIDVGKSGAHPDFTYYIRYRTVTFSDGH